jgi:FAD-dependent urate hydroxylase
MIGELETLPVASHDAPGISRQLQSLDHGAQLSRRELECAGEPLDGRGSGKEQDRDALQVRSRQREDRRGRVVDRVRGILKAHDLVAERGNELLSFHALDHATRRSIDNVAMAFRSKIQQNAAGSGKTAHAGIATLSNMETATKGKRAVVIGCGIGGPVIAMALQRAGIDSVIYEAHEATVDSVGSFLNTASNGLDALRALDLDLAKILADGFPTPQMVMWSWTGKRLGEVANGLTLPDGTVSITIKRGLLHRALRDAALRRGIKIETGKRLVSAEALPEGGAVARFADGTAAAGDFLVGADGLHSRTRRVVDPRAPSPRYTGQLSLGGIAPATRLAPTPNEYHMIFGKRAFFGYSVRQSGEAYWFANVLMAEPTRESLAAISPSQWKRELVTLFADDAGAAVEMINATGDELAAYPIYDMPTLPIWHRGPIVVVGDAAHATSPSSGQGASMAIEDAIVLARCLRDLPDVAQAFAAYERCRRQRVERVVRYSKRVGSTKVAGTVGRFFRDLMMPAALRMFAGSKAHDWLYSYHIDWSERAPAY